jgi:cyclopropane fatty-acyl-phospholipid synthase-like methyltransferase
MTAMARAYDPSVFDVASMEQAARIVLTPENATTEERWAKETPYLADLVCDRLGIAAKSTLLGYGCGIGRIARHLIERAGCRVIGTDIGGTMRELAARYVDSPRFTVLAPSALESRAEIAHAAIAVWVLQHCERPKDDIARIHRALKSDGRLFIANNRRRAVPMREVQLFTAAPTVLRHWIDDGEDVRALLQERFVLAEEGEFPPGFPGIIPGQRYWAVFQKR